MRTVRGRTALVAALVVAAAFVVLSVFLLQGLRSSLIEEIDRSNAARANDLVAANELEINDLALSADESTVAALLILIEDDEFETLATDDNLTSEQVLAAFPEPDVPGTVSWPNLTDTIGSENMRGVTKDLTLFDEEEGASFIVGDFVLVASSLDAADRSVADLRRNLLIVGPLLTLIVATLAWLLTGWALRPVEDIRAEAESIRGSELHRRVPETGADDEIGRLASTFNSMLGRLEESQRAQQQFVSDASHELRSPLASIAAQLDVDAAHPGTADTAETAEVVRLHTQRMQAMIEDLLLLARADDAAITLPTALVDLDDVVTEVAHTIVVPDGITIDLAAVSGAQVRGHDVQIGRLITNLATNAVRHASSAVSIVVEERDSTVAVTVGDDGDGVDPEQHEAIFERFVRLDEARARDAGGSGLGLAISREIARFHGAQLTVGRSVLGGAAFTVEFPKAPLPE